VAALSYRGFAEYDLAEGDAVVRLPAGFTGNRSRASRSAAR
jgi:hypothetical protein